MEASDFYKRVVLVHIDNIVLGVHAIPVIVKRNLARFATNVSRLQVPKQSLAC